MFSWMGRTAWACLGPFRRYSRMDRDENVDDSLFWSLDIEQHSTGQFSIAVVQANESIEDHSQVETGHGATFVGVYDGHGGPDASKFISDNLFVHLIRLAQERGMTFSEDVVRRAFSATEEGFLAHVRRTKEVKPLITAIGSCCLVGLIWEGTLYVANLGDSRAVIGCLGRSNDIVAEQLTQDHNASMEEVRQELKALHPDDSQVVVMKHGVWRIKGIIQVSRSIGDAYLKSPEFTVDPSVPRFRLSEPLRRAVLSAEPSIYTRVINVRERFVIFASDGLWEHLTNQEAVEIVHKYPRAGIARRLVRSALDVAAKKREMRYADLKKLDRGVRRYFHDDISVIVLFIDHDLLSQTNTAVPDISVRGFIDRLETSDFSTLAGPSADGSSSSSAV